jgi:hypothetical protein
MPARYRRFRTPSAVAYRRELEAESARREALARRCPRTAALRSELSHVVAENLCPASALPRLELTLVWLGAAFEKGQELSPEQAVELRRDITGLLQLNGDKAAA